MTDTSPVTIDTPHGQVTMPWLQAKAIADLIDKYTGQGRTATWHQNECGCCYSVHEDIEHFRSGYVVDRRGEYDWLEWDDLHEHSEKSEGSEEPAG